MEKVGAKGGMSLTTGFDVQFDFKKPERPFAESFYSSYNKELGSDDAYSRVLDGEHRDIVKTAFNAMIQANTPLKSKPKDIDLDKVEIKTSEDQVNPVSVNDSVSIEFNYPSAEDLATLATATEEAPIWEVSQRCIRSIHTTDATFEAEDLSEEEKAEYIENLTFEEFNNIKEFFNTMPVMENELSLKCEKCGENNIIYMNGYLDFFD